MGSANDFVSNGWQARLTNWVQLLAATAGGMVGYKAWQNPEAASAFFSGLWENWLTPSVDAGLGTWAACIGLWGYGVALIVALVGWVVICCEQEKFTSPISQFLKEELQDNHRLSIGHFVAITAMLPLEVLYQALSIMKFAVIGMVFRGIFGKLLGSRFIPVGTKRNLDGL